MKRKLLPVVFLFAGLIAAGLIPGCSNDNPDDPYVTITDAEFMRFLLNDYDLDGDGVINRNEAMTVTSLDLRGRRSNDGTWQGLGIKSLEGIRAFGNLKTLYCSFNKITSLDLTGNKALRELDCSFNNIVALDVSSCRELESLSCHKNDMTVLNVWHNEALQTLNCDDNTLTELNVANNKLLKSLSCFRTGLRSLDIANNIDLESLCCSNNSLTVLNLGRNTALKELDCSLNSLTALPLSKLPNLVKVDCSFNDLGNMLDLYSNALLTSVDSRNNPGLQYILLRQGTNIDGFRIDAHTEILYK